MGTIAGTGMNALELQANKQLTGGFKQSDLNRNSTLPFPDNSFDVVTCVVRMPLVFAPPPPASFITYSSSQRCLECPSVSLYLAHYA